MQGQADLKHVQFMADLKQSCEIESVETNFQIYFLEVRNQR